MKFKYLVFSSDWETEVDAIDPLEAALLGTEERYLTLKERFNIAESVIVVKEKLRNDPFAMVEAYSSVSIFEDLGRYFTANSLRKAFKRINKS